MSQPVFLTSGDIVADRRYAFAQDLLARGDLAAAADLLAQVVELAPRFASGWFALGEVRERAGDRAGAAAAFAEACAADPQDRHGASLRLARLNGDRAAMPEGYVRALFDQYAPRFDQSLVCRLNYRGPEIVLAAVESAAREQGRAIRFGSVLDLGCGTGLCGAAIRPYADWLVGVDLSDGMIAQARGKGVYDRLHAAELVAFLAGEAECAAKYHLVTAADVLVYCADLAPVASAVARVLAPDGLFVFTVETHESGDVILRDTLRFAHPLAHVREALAKAGLVALLLEPASTRNEKGVLVPGLVAAAALGSSPLADSATP